MASINVCSSDKLFFNSDERTFTYTDTYGESWSFDSADEFESWWYDEGGPDLGPEVERFLLEHNGCFYMNTATGSVGSYDEWDYEDENGDEVNAVDLGEVVEVVEIDGQWVEV